MINHKVLDLLKICIPKSTNIDVDDEKRSIIVTVPQADSMFFRSEGNNPILQHIVTFKRYGVEFDPIFETNEDSIVLHYHYATREEMSDWRSLIECDDFVLEEEEDDFLLKIFAR